MLFRPGLCRQLSRGMVYYRIPILASYNYDVEPIHRDRGAQSVRVGRQMGCRFGNGLRQRAGYDKGIVNGIFLVTSCARGYCVFYFYLRISAPEHDGTFIQTRLLLHGRALL